MYIGYQEPTDQHGGWTTDWQSDRTQPFVRSGASHEGQWRAGRCARIYSGRQAGILPYSLSVRHPNGAILFLRGSLGRPRLTTNDVRSFKQCESCCAFGSRVVRISTSYGSLPFFRETTKGRGVTSSCQARSNNVRHSTQAPRRHRYHRPCRPSGRLQFRVRALGGVLLS